MDAYKKINELGNIGSISESLFYQLIKEFRSGYLNIREYESRVKLHRNPIEVLNELYTELCSYSIKIQSREELRDFDETTNCWGYIPTRIIEIWKSDKRLKSLYNATNQYCQIKEKNPVITLVHIAEYRAINKLIGKMQHIRYKNESWSSRNISLANTPLKKKRIKIPKENKIRAELQKEIGSLCPFCDNSDVGHFEIHHINNDPSNNNSNNLILLCPTCHSKITKGDILQSEVIEKKNALISKQLGSSGNTAKIINFNSKINNAIIGDNNKISIVNQKKRVREKYPPGCIGYETEKANYISHLIDRYNEFKAYEVGKEAMKYGIFQSHLKKRFKIGGTRTLYNLPAEKFTELIEYIQSRINDTKLAKLKGLNHKNYSSFEEYRR